MKKSLRDKLLLHIEKLQKRAEQLTKNIQEYADADNYEAAAKNKIKRDMIDFEIEQLLKLL